MKKLTELHREILRRLNGAGPRPQDNLYIRGASEVRAARTLEERGLLKLEDNGAFGRRSDGERFSATLTPEGEAEAARSTIERDRYAKVWTLTPESARAFFAQGDDSEVVVLKERPESDREKQKYCAEAKLFGVEIKR